MCRRENDWVTGMNIAGHSDPEQEVSLMMDDHKYFIFSVATCHDNNVIDLCQGRTLFKFDRSENEAERDKSTVYLMDLYCSSSTCQLLI